MEKLKLGQVVGPIIQLLCDKAKMLNTGLNCSPIFFLIIKPGRGYIEAKHCSHTSPEKSTCPGMH